MNNYSSKPRPIAARPRQDDGSGTMDPFWINPEYPTDTNAERMVVACLMDAPRLTPEVLGILDREAMFHSDAYRALFNVLVSLYQKDKPPIFSNIMQGLIARQETMLVAEAGVDILGLPSEARATDCIETAIYLRTLWVKRVALDGARAVQLSVHNNDPVDEVVFRSNQLAETLSAGLTMGRDKTMDDYAQEYLAWFQGILDNPGTLTGINTGSKKLNEITGGWQKTDVIMLGGRPGAGKTIAGVFHATAAALDGQPVAYISLEMAALSLLNRMVSEKSGVKYSDIKKGRVAPHEVIQIMHGVNAIRNLPIHWYDDPEHLDIADIAYKLRYWKKKYDIQLVVIDYVQLIQDRTVKGGDEYAVATSVSKKLKQLQRILGIPLLLLAQLNRGVESRSGSKRPAMSDIRQTGQYEQDASVIAMLFREDYYAEREAQEEFDRTGVWNPPVRTNNLEYGFVKNRDGDTGSAVLWADVAYNKVLDEEVLVYTPQSSPEREVGKLTPLEQLFPTQTDIPF